MAETITVACKLPHGLELQLQREEKAQEPTLGGSKTVKRYVKAGEIVTIKGWAHPAESAPLVPIAGGFALTHGIDAEFWALWLEQNADHPAVKGGFIYASGKAADVEAHTRLYESERSGFEPHDPKNPIPEFSRRIETAQVA